MTNIFHKNSKVNLYAYKYKIVGVFLLFSLTVLPAQAGTVVQCGNPVCASNFSIFADTSGVEIGGGQFMYNAATGKISLDLSNIRGNGVATSAGGLMWSMGDGSHIMINSLYGNADPVLGFSVGASTAASSHSFSFAFDLPIALSGPINADSSVSYSLTSTTPTGAQITPLFGNHVVTANEVDTSIGGIGTLNKGIDVGDAFYFSGGPQTQNSPIFTATNTFTGNLAYDLMSVQVGFALSAHSNVGISGFVQQVPVPLPAALPLMLSCLAGLGFFTRSGINRRLA